MEEPQPKRVKRPDSASMWDRNTSTPRHDRDSKSNGRKADPPARSRSRSPSPSRSGSKEPERTSRKRRDRDEWVPRGERDARDRRDRDRDRGDRERDREKPRSTKRNGFLCLRLARNANSGCATGDGRRRSRSPPPRASPSGRQTLLPRGPRAGGISERERDRERERGVEGDRERSTRGPKTNGVSQPSNSKPSASRKGRPNGDVTDKDVSMTNGDVDPDDEESVLRKMMGFEAFRSTKNTKVPGNDKNFGVRKDKKTKYRQYMNRSGGFNRPLSPG
jgi:U4/U6.U5 tri-snRNP-associated protein 3